MVKVKEARVTCKKCWFYPGYCGYWQPKRDKGGNISTLPNPDMLHECRDFKRKEG